MKKSDLFDIGIKLFGVNLLITSVLNLKDFILMLSIQKTLGSIPGNFDQDMISVNIAYLSNIVIQVLLGLLLVFQSQYITRRIIKTESDTTADFTVDKQSGIEVACVIIGGLMITTALSTLGNQFISFIQFKRAEFDTPSTGIPNMLWQVFMIFVGYCFIAGHAWIGKHFARKP
jgi:hypothetical protein